MGRGFQGYVPGDGVFEAFYGDVGLVDVVEWAYDISDCALVGDPGDFLAGEGMDGGGGCIAKRVAVGRGDQYVIDLAVLLLGLAGFLDRYRLAVEEGDDEGSLEAELLDLVEIA